MKALLKKIFVISFAFTCITSTKAQVSNPQSKIKDYKLKHDLLLHMKQNQHLKSSIQSFGLKTNPYWQDVNAPHVINNSHIPQVQVPSPNAVWAKVDYDTSAYNANQFIRSRDFGRTWRQDSIDAPNGYGLSSISAVDANTCYAAMYDAFNYGGAMFKTSDGGDTWKQVQPGKLYSANSFPDFVYFFDAQHGLTVGDDDLTDTSRPEIYTTSDAGKTWQRVPDRNLPVTQGYAFSTNFNPYAVFQNRFWFIAGDTYGNNYIYRSDDLGRHWQQFPYTANSFNAFTFSDKQNGLAVGLNFGVGTYEEETHDGGKTWADKSFTGYPMGLSIAAIPFTHTYVTTAPQFVNTPVTGSSYSNDFGATWKLIDSSSDFNPFTVSFLNPLVGWCGRADSQDPNGGMYRWRYQFSLDKDAVADVASSFNEIVATKNTTGLSVYPNPVSNAATISFTLPQSQKVSLQIFDESGRLIKNIANSPMEAGAHQFTWNASDENGTAVAKGMYYLKFNAGSYAETKKLAVIK